jgi:hypothetical protein
MRRKHCRISYAARERLKQQRPGQDPRQHAHLTMWSHFARSLDAHSFDLERHRSWQCYALANLTQSWTREAWGDAVVDALVGLTT